MVGGFNEGRLMRIRSSRQINENNNYHVLYTAIAIHTHGFFLELDARTSPTYSAYFQPVCQVELPSTH